MKSMGLVVAVESAVGGLLDSFGGGGWPGPGRSPLDNMYRRFKSSDTEYSDIA